MNNTYYDYVTAAEIAKIQEVMGLNNTKFAEVCGAASGQSVSNWKSGKTRPKGVKYDRLRMPKKQFLSDANRTVIRKAQPTPVQADTNKWVKYGQFIETFQEFPKEDQQVLLVMLKELV